MHARLSVALVLGLWAAQAQAEDITLPEKPWKANADLGYIRTSGSNGSKQTFRGKLFGEYKFTVWSHEGKAEAIGTHDDVVGSSDTERYLLGTKSKRSFTEVDYLFVQSQWEKDVESDFEYQAFLATGYGRKLLHTDEHKLNAEIGAGWRNSEPRHDYTKNEAIGNFNLDYLWQISKDTSFVQKVAVEAGKENVVTRSLTELKQNVNASLAVSLAYDYKHDDGEENTREGTTTFNLTYRFH